jgi:hypothetical protein
LPHKNKIIVNEIEHYRKGAFSNILLNISFIKELLFFLESIIMQDGKLRFTPNSRVSSIQTENKRFLPVFITFKSANTVTIYL